MNNFIIIAGPQASGKTTCKKVLHDLLTKEYPKKNIISLEEAGQIVIKKHNASGGMFLQSKHEHEIINLDINRMKIILENSGEENIYIDETNIFTLAHATTRGIEVAKKIFFDYLELLRRLEAKIIFLDTPPETSWKRRKKTYAKRSLTFPESKRNEIMKGFENYLKKLHPQLIEIFKKTELSKIKIDSSLPHQEILDRISIFLKI